MEDHYNDWKLLLCKLPVSRVLQEDYTKNEDRFLNLAISWILLGLLAVLDTHLKKMYSRFDIILMPLRLFIILSHLIELDSLRQADWLNNVENCP